MFTREDIVESAGLALLALSVIADFAAFLGIVQEQWPELLQ